MLAFVPLVMLSLFLALGLLGCGLSEAEKHYNAGAELQEQGRLEDSPQLLECREASPNRTEDLSKGFSNPPV